MADRQKALEAADAASQNDSNNKMAANSHMQIPLMLTGGPMQAPPTGYAPGYGAMPPMHAPPTGYAPQQHPQQAYATGQPAPMHRAW